MRTAAKRILGTKLKAKKISKTPRGKTKIKLKIKAGSPEAMTGAVKKLADGITET
jgi:hypothetical protein